MTPCCPVCGNALPKGVVPVEQLDKLVETNTDTTPMQLRLYDVLRAAYPYARTRQEIADKLYAFRTDGGPTYSAATVGSHVLYLRRKLRRFGWTVTLVHKHRGIALRPLREGE